MRSARPRASLPAFRCLVFRRGRVASYTEIETVSGRIRRLLQKQWRQRIKTIWVWLQQRLENLRLPVRLPCGTWWVPRNDHVGELIRRGNFETLEHGFVQRFLQ